MDYQEQPLTKKQRKELRKLEKQKRQQAEKKKQTLTYLLLSFIVLIIIILFIAALSFSKGKIEDVKADLDPIFGHEDAPVEIREYSDFTCPACRMATEIIKQVKDEYPDKVKIIYNDLPNTEHKNSFESAYAAQCAWKQDKFWGYHDLLFEKQAEWTREDKINKKLVEYAQSLNLDTDSFKQCLDSKEYKERIERDIKEAITLGLDSTPTFFVNDEKIIGVRTFDQWKEIIGKKLSE